MTEAQEFFINMFRDYLKGKVSDTVAYEYIRIVRKFMESARNISQTNEDAMKEVATEFLDIDNPNSYRNTLAALKKLFEFIGQPQVLENFKYKATMPSFSIKTPSLEEMVKFGKAIENDKIKVYYYLGVVSAIRPEHCLG
jgi:hypothetical protein